MPRIVLTSDLHYNVARSRVPTIRLAEEICGLRADALVILGDVAGNDLGILREGLHLFDRFAGRKFFVAGNHDIWSPPGACSLERHEKHLPEVCREVGFHALEFEPVVLDGVGLAGCMGWYDFSYRPARLRIPLRFYRAKIAPGAASRFDRYTHLLDEMHDVPEESMQMGTRWMDGEHVRLPMSDIDFCRYQLERLDRQLHALAAQCETIVVGMHHVPFAELVPFAANPSWAFAGTFLGSELFGEVLLKHAKVRYVYCGHTHKQGRVRRGPIECINTGCTYMTKRYEILELPPV